MPPWFVKRELAAGLTVLTEPAVHGFFCANLYFLGGRDRDLLVDTGMGLAPLAGELPVTPGKPLVAVATHIHLDHVGSLHEFAERWGPAVSADAFATMPDESTYADMFRTFAGGVERLPYDGWDQSSYSLRPAPLTRRLSEGDTIDLGDRHFTVLSLPGHSPDSIGLLDETDGLFFSGDAIYPGGLIDDLPDSDPAAYRETMRRILDLTVRIAHGGHGESMTPAEMAGIARAYLDGDG